MMMMVLLLLCLTRAGSLSSPPGSSLSSPTRRILSSLEGEAAFGAGASGTYRGLEALDEGWRRMRSGRPRPPVAFVKEVAELPPADSDAFDCVVLGGTLGIFYAAALQARGLRCAVVERGVIRGREQEWNLSLDEVRALVDAGVFADADVDGAVDAPAFKEVATAPEGTLVASHFGAVRAGFNEDEVDDDQQEIWMPQVLNVGVRPNVAVERAKANFVRLGGTVFEETTCAGVRVAKAKAATTEDNKSRKAAPGVFVDLGSDDDAADQEVLRTKVVIDAMGNLSPIARQARTLLNGGVEPRPSGVCCVVGTLATGFDKDNSYGDLIYTNENSRADRQYFWEAFPASFATSARTTYLFTYLDVDDATAHSVEAQFDDYWSLLPKYQRRNHDAFRRGLSAEEAIFKEGSLKIHRALYGLFPTYKQSPLKSPWDGVLAVGDASGVQSPLSFGGFGALTRHVGRIADAVNEAVEADALGKDDLSMINPYLPNLSATWMFQKTFVVPTASTRPPNFVNRLMRLNYVNMQDLGDDVMRPFNQDVVQPAGLLKVLALATLRDPLNIPLLLYYTGPAEILDWSKHFLTMFLYDVLHRLLGSLSSEDNNNTMLQLPPRVAYRLRRLAEAWEYGSGNDYTH